MSMLRLDPGSIPGDGILFYYFFFFFPFHSSQFRSRPWNEALYATLLVQLRVEASIGIIQPFYPLTWVSSGNMDGNNEFQRATLRLSKHCVGKREGQFCFIIAHPRSDMMVFASCFIRVPGKSEAGSTLQD